MRNTGNNNWGYNMSKDIEFSSSDIKSEYNKPEKKETIDCDECGLIGDSFSCHDCDLDGRIAYNKGLDDSDKYYKQEMDKLRERLLREVNSAYEKGFNDNRGAN